MPQDVNDEPASVLLECIAAEKAQLVKEGKLKKQKPLPEISEEEKPFELPQGWEWSRVNELSKQVTDGVHHTPKYIESGVPFISVKDIDGKTVSFADCKYISQEQHEEINQRCNPELGDILICRIGTLGRATIVDTSEPFSLFVSVGLLKFFNESLLSGYLHKVFHSPLLLRQYDEIKAGGSHTNKLNLGDIPRLWIPVAPIAEQRRIVAKVDELMSLCDALETQTEASIAAHQTLVETLLNALLLPQTAANTASQADVSLERASENSLELPVTNSVVKDWQRVAEHFDILFTTSASIDTLKQTILQLAVMGKLVKQDPNDEPAAKLLARIAKEKAQLFKEGKIKKQKPLPAITDEEKLFELPLGWSYVRLDDICFAITSGSTPPKEKFNEETGVPYLKVYNIKNQKIDFYHRSQFVESNHHTNKLTRSILYPGDVVMNIVGPPLGKIAIIPDEYPEWNCNQAIVFFRPLELKLNSYIYTYLISGVFLQSIELIGTAGQDNISVTKSRSIVIPLPPLEEQHRIVAKVEELMALCDQLKVRLADAQITQLHLTDAIVEQAI
ncbi:restriction endonuclease subunit S [Shewanella baltica]|uniref:restriction endonuclease subunit S n=1 Tax=Shewanella baltica TaxID=62322 RepID=UPI000DFC975D|nr:restriction endonuclease subunit S [Shewanella baltica]SUI61453.1 EcoKI restriction-modification system protein HsdS [Shewanella baltica]